MIDLGLADTVLDGLRRVHAERSATLCHVLRETLPSARFVEPLGGYFVWLQLPPDMFTARLLPIAQQEGVSVHPGTRFTTGDSFSHSARLSFAHYDATELPEGVRRLARALARFAPGADPTAPVSSPLSS
jgi:DNA-binding transcriptional MocR family regulator